MIRLSYILGMICCFVFLGMAVQYVPPTKGVAHSKNACSLYMAEDYHPYVSGRELNNYTDATMILVANGVKDESGWRAFFNTPLYTIFKSDLYFVYIDIFPLESICRDDLEHYKIYYPRYWHGYQIFLRPLLYFTDYKHIRQINLYLQVWLFGLILWLMWQNKAKGLMLGWALSYLIFNPEAMAMNMAYSVLYYVSAVSMLLLLTCRRWIKERLGYPIFFAMIGICTCFFDFLTYPIVPLATSLTLLFYLEPETEFKSMLRKLVMLTACFGGAYVGMWVLKWILASLLTEQNVVADVFNAVIHRTKSQIDYILKGEEVVEKFPRGFAIVATWRVLFAIPETVAAVTWSFILSLAPLVWRAKKTWLYAKNNSVTLLPFVAIATSTLFWCFIVGGHPLQHASYTYRLWVATFFPLIVMLNFWYIKSKEADNAQTQG